MFTDLQKIILKKYNDNSIKVMKCDEIRGKKMKDILKLNDAARYTNQRDSVYKVYKTNIAKLDASRKLLNDLSKDLNTMQIKIISQRFEDRAEIHDFVLDDFVKLDLFAKLEAYYKKQKTEIAGLCMNGEVSMALDRTNAISFNIIHSPHRSRSHHHSRSRSRNRNKAQSVKSKKSGVSYL
jgi:hypothetical protein